MPPAVPQPADRNDGGGGGNPPAGGTESGANPAGCSHRLAPLSSLRTASTAHMRHRYCPYRARPVSIAPLTGSGGSRLQELVRRSGWKLGAWDTRWKGAAASGSGDTAAEAGGSAAAAAGGVRPAQREEVCDESELDAAIAFVATMRQ